MIAGADAHGFPSYERLFSVARNHLVLEHPPSGDAQVDAAAIVTALRRGRGYVGIDALASTRGFSFVAEAGGRKWTMGDSVPVDPPPRLRVGGALPERAMVTLYRDGGVIKEAAGELEWPDATAGVYRVEVRLPGWDVPWVLSNAIDVLDPAAQDARQRRGRVPPPIVAETAQVLDDFEAGGRFEPASDTSTTLDRIATVPDSGERGSVARLRFKLGTPPTAIPSPFAALVNLQPRTRPCTRGTGLFDQGRRGATSLGPGQRRQSAVGRRHRMVVCVGQDIDRMAPGGAALRLVFAHAIRGRTGRSM